MDIEGLNHNAEKLYEALGISIDRATEIRDDVRRLISSNTKASIVIEEIMNNANYNPNEKILALIYLGTIIGYHILAEKIMNAFGAVLSWGEWSEWLTK